MSTSHSKWQSVRHASLNAVYVAVFGLSAGFLTGLSVSPVVSMVLGSVLAVMLSAITALAGLEYTASETAEDGDDEKQLNSPKLHKRVKVNLFPVAAFSLCIAVGSCIGIYARTNAWFGARQAKVAALQPIPGPVHQDISGQAATSTVCQDELKNAPKQLVKAASAPTPERSSLATKKPVGQIVVADPTMPGLYVGTAPPDSCAELRGTPEQERKGYVQRLAHSFNQPLFKAVLKCTSRDCLQLAEDILCPTSKS